MKFLLLMFPLAPVWRGPYGGFLPRVPLVTLALPWARFHILKKSFFGNLLHFLHHAEKHPVFNGVFGCRIGCRIEFFHMAILHPSCNFPEGILQGYFPEYATRATLYFMPNFVRTDGTESFFIMRPRPTRLVSESGRCHSR